MSKHKKNTYLFVVFCVFVIIISIVLMRFFKPSNPYRLDEFEVADKKRIDLSLEEWEATMIKTKNIIQHENMDDTVISIGNKKITRKEFESVRIRLMDIYSYTLKETVYEIVKECVILQEAERLNLVPDQEKINYYMDGIYDALKSENEPGFKFENSRIRIFEMTQDEFIEEQKKIAYEFYQKEALYARFDNNEKKFEEYVKKLLRSANIKIHDIEIEKECLK